VSLLVSVSPNAQRIGRLRPSPVLKDPQGSISQIQIGPAMKSVGDASHRLEKNYQPALLLQYRRSYSANDRKILQHYCNRQKRFKFVTWPACINSIIDDGTIINANSLT
jgi:hypothetical protein